MRSQIAYCGNRGRCIDSRDVVDEPSDSNDKWLRRQANTLGGDCISCCAPFPNSELVRVLFDALADMYSHRDGPWVDELRQAVLTDPDAPDDERIHCAAVVDDLRRTLLYRSDN